MASAIIERVETGYFLIPLEEDLVEAIAPDRQGHGLAFDRKALEKPKAEG